MKRIHRFLSIVLALGLCVGIFPVSSMTAFAVSNGKAIQLGTDALNKNVNTANAQTVYFGENHNNSPAKWRVIGYGGSGAASVSGNMTLLAKSQMGTPKFDNDGNSNVYADSDLKKAVDTLVGKLMPEETAAVVKRTLEVGTYSENEPYCDGVAVTEVKDAVFWPLSTNEAMQVNEELRKLSFSWWLRSPGANLDGDNDDAAFVNAGGVVKNDGSHVGGGFDLRPAFYLNLSSVLFTSSAKDGKFSGTAGADALSKIGDYSGDEWKLTLLDTNRKGFSVSQTSLSGAAGSTVNIDYSGAKTGSNEYVSVMIMEGDTILYYGCIVNNQAEGKAALTIPADLAVGSYTLKVFSEQLNGNYKTDYASAFKEIALTVEEPHVHSWEYSGNGAKITASCVGTGTCDYIGTEKELTISTPEKTTYGDTNSANAALSGTGLAGQTSIPAIKYVGRDGTVYTESDMAPTDAGKYTAKITVDTATASVNYSIGKATPTVDTEPTASQVIVGGKLSDSTLTGGVASISGTFAWEDGTEVLDTVTTVAKRVVFTPDDTANYNTVEFDVEVAVVICDTESGEQETEGGIDKEPASPDTGDNSNMALWITLLFVSGAGVLITTVISKKRYAR